MEHSKVQFSNEKQKDKEVIEEKYRSLSSMAFMIVVIIIGVPMWWKTTEVYRVNLPSNNIQSLSDQAIVASVKIGIFAFDPQRVELLITELNKAFSETGFVQIKFEAIPMFEHARSVHTPSGLEAEILKHYTINTGDFIFIEWLKLQEEVLLTNERSAFIRPDTSYSQIKNVVNIFVLQTHRIEKILNLNASNGAKAEAPQAVYDIIVSVINPRPNLIDVKWNVAMAVETYLVPFLETVSDISNYTVKTQWRYQLPFEAELKQVRDTNKLGRFYALPKSALPHIITSIEKNMVVGITTKTAINLVVYIPPCDIAPVHIYDENERINKSYNVDSFISSKWGGIIISNPPLESCVAYLEDPIEPVRFHVNTNDVMQIMLYQLQRLLDISIEFKNDKVKEVALEQIGSRRWEYEAYIRRSAFTHIVTATNTLQSLIKLLDNISYIVINDAVGNAINDAYEHIVLAKNALVSNQLSDASHYAKIAFMRSEEAFFDSSLLSQLYFPDEQKYAIYIPLFLPIMVPVITSFGMLRKMCMKFCRSNKLKIN